MSEHPHMNRGEPAGLQEHTEFLRRLARGLLVDPGKVEDALQETWLVALRQEGEVSRGWLAGVVRRVASQMRRGERRRLCREQEAAAREALPSAADSVARLEATQRLVQAVVELPEPYRSVLLMRYFDDLSYQEIADVLQVKLGTVMSRLSRAKVRLHGVLSEGEGE